MNKRLSTVVILSALLSSTPTKPITHLTANVLTAASALLYYTASKNVLGSAAYYDLIDQGGPTQRYGTKVGSAALTAATCWALYKLAPNGRYNRATDIVQNLKDKFPRALDEASTNNLDQILHDLGAFTKTYKNNRNFVYLNAIQELDCVTSKLKKAESLLFAAKKDIFPEPFEWCKVNAQKLYAKAYARIKKTPEVQVADAQNHTELTAKIDALIVEVQSLLNRVTGIYSYIELHGSVEFKQQLKDYEELRSMRTKNTRSAVINFAIPTATVVGSLALAVIAARITMSMFRRPGNGNPGLRAAGLS